MIRQLAGAPIGNAAPCRIVAELSNNHNGSLSRARRLIEAAAEAGADIVKFQCYTPQELVELRGDGPAPDPWGSDGWSMRDLYRKAQTPLDWFPALVAHAGRVGIPWFSSVFGPSSLFLLEQLDCPAYKIAALDHGNMDLLEEVAFKGKQLVQSVRQLGSPHVMDHDIVLQCPPGYPQDPHDIAWDGIRHGSYDGLSYHGTDWRVPAKAVEFGAKIIEVHFHLEDEPSELEANVSLTEHDLKCLASRTASASAAS